MITEFTTKFPNLWSASIQLNGYILWHWFTEHFKESGVKQKQEGEMPGKKYCEEGFPLNNTGMVLFFLDGVL